MFDTFTKPQGKQTVQTIESETILHTEPELLVPIIEYASRHGLSRRTIDRYVQIGRLETTKQHGRTYILDKPLQPQPNDSEPVRNFSDSQLVRLSQTDWMQLGFFKARSKSKTLWQTYAIVLTVLFFAMTLASLWLFTQWRFLTTSGF